MGYNEYQLRQLTHQLFISIHVHVIYACPQC